MVLCSAAGKFRVTGQSKHLGSSVEAHRDGGLKFVDGESTLCSEPYGIWAGCAG